MDQMERKRRNYNNSIDAPHRRHRNIFSPQVSNPTVINLNDSSIENVNAKSQNNSRNHKGSIVNSEGAGKRMKLLNLLKNQTMSSPIDETDDSDSEFFKELNNSEGLTELLHKNDSQDEKLKNMSSKLLALKGNVFSESEEDNQAEDSAHKMAENFFEFALKHMSHLTEDVANEYIREQPKKIKDHSKVDDI